MWQALCEKFEERDIVNQERLKFKLLARKMKPDENSAAFINSFEEILANLNKVDEKFTDREASLIC